MFSPEFFIFAGDKLNKNSLLIDLLFNLYYLLTVGNLKRFLIISYILTYIYHKIILFLVYIKLFNISLQL